MSKKCENCKYYSDERCYCPDYHPGRVSPLDGCDKFGTHTDEKKIMTKTDLISLCTLITMRLYSSGIITSDQDTLKKVCEIINGCAIEIIAGKKPTNRSKTDE